NARIGTHRLARLGRKPDRAGDVEARPHTWRMFPRQLSVPSRRPTASSRRLGLKKRRGFKTTRMARASTVRTPNMVKLDTSCPPGQAWAASSQIFPREKNAAQTAH